VDLGDARERLGGVGKAAFEVGVDWGGGELCGEGAGVLGFCAVGAGVVDEFVYCGLGFVRVVAIQYLVSNMFILLLLMWFR
jgi:hypothetical protein